MMRTGPDSGSLRVAVASLELLSAPLQLCLVREVGGPVGDCGLLASFANKHMTISRGI